MGIRQARDLPLLVQAGFMQTRCLSENAAECLTTLREYDNNGAAAEGSRRLRLRQPPTSHRLVDSPLGRM